MNGLVDFLKFQNLLGRHVDQDTLKNIGGCVVDDRSDFPLEIIPWLERPDLRLFRLLEKHIAKAAAFFHQPRLDKNFPETGDFRCRKGITRIDRKSVDKGKSESVRVYLVGSRP